MNVDLNLAEEGGGGGSPAASASSGPQTAADEDRSGHQTAAAPERGGHQTAAGAQQPAAVQRGPRRSTTASFYIRGQAERDQTQEVWAMTQEAILNQALKTRAAQIMKWRGF